jgi:hypothetical protein
VNQIASVISSEFPQPANEREIHQTHGCRCLRQRERELLRELLHGVEKLRRAIDAPGVAVVHLAAAACLSELGRLEEARNGLLEVERLSPDLRPKLLEDLAFRQIHPDLIAAIAGAIGRIDAGWLPPARARWPEWPHGRAG